MAKLKEKQIVYIRAACYNEIIFLGEEFCFPRTTISGTGNCTVFRLKGEDEMKRRIVIGALLAALAFSMAACGSTGGTDGAADGAGQETELNQGAAKEEVEKEEAVPYAAGVWTDNVYTNESLGMTFPLPEGWQYGTQEELAEMMGSGQEVTGYTDEELSATDPIYDLYIYNNSTGASIMMMAEDMSVYGDISVDFKDMEDGILIKSDGMPTYNFANVVDDHLMGITHVIRGSEYLSSTPKYNLMYDAFGWERPTYIHLPPIMKDERHKLSKRNGDASYADFVEKGFVKEAIVNYIALLGWSPKDNAEKMSLAEMTARFSLDGISKSPSIFDETKMRWLSGEYIKEMSDEEFVSRGLEFFKKSKVYGKYDLKKIAALLKTRVETFGEIPEKIDFLEEFGAYDTALYTHKKMKTDENIARIVLPAARETLAALPAFDYQTLHDGLMALVGRLGMKNGQVLWCVRVALSGRESTPGGVMELAELLGREESLKRLDYSMKLLGS